MRIKKLFQIALTALTIVSVNCHADDASDLLGKLSQLAQQGNAEAQYHVGMMLNNGSGVGKDPKKAFEWFSKSAKAGDPLGAYKLGCYYSGQFPDAVPTDTDKAQQYKLIAAKAGYALAQYDLGILLYQQEKFQEAIQWWESAAKQGYPMALYNLSVTYRAGEVTPKNPAQAYAYFKLAKLISEKSINSNAQQTLNQAKSEMSASELTKAEDIVARWKSEPTALTVKARDGINAAMALASQR